jgi:flagellin
MTNPTVINTNTASINGQRNLYRSASALNKSLERLSSGLRINRAGDDAAGLAISENLRSQIKGMDQAVRNANDGVSLIQTAEGAMDTYTEILQRIRQLSIQASSDLYNDNNRQSIQLEVDQQVKELRRIAEVMNFNGQKLFDGSFYNKRIQVGASAGETLELSVGDLRPSVIGGVAQQIGVQVDGTALTDGGIQINGVNIPSSSDESAASKVRAINSMYADTKVWAKVEDSQVVGTAAIAAGTLDLATGTTLRINGFVVPSEGTLAVTASDSSGALRRAINMISDKTGVTASINAGGRLVLTSNDDLPFTYNISNAAAQGVVNLAGAVTTDQTVRGRVRLYSDSTFTVAGATALAQIGVTGTIPFDTKSPIENVSIYTFSEAQETINMVDNALRQLNDTRSALGAITNRLEGTVSNLQIAVENLSASDSRIRDADFAVETSSMTRAQILQQSGIAVLSQANSSPQMALKLLS